MRHIQHPPMLAIHRVPLLDRRKSKTTAERLADTRHTASLIKSAGARGDLMGEHKHTLKANIFLAAVLLFSIVTTSMGIKGVWQLITS